MTKISWGRKMGFTWGLASGLAIAAAVAYGEGWVCFLTLLPARRHVSVRRQRHGPRRRRGLHDR